MKCCIQQDLARPLMAYGRIAALLAIASTFCFSGCGGSSAASRPPRLVEYPDEEYKAPPPAPKPAAKAKAAPEEPIGRDDYEQYVAGPPPKPEYPTNYAEWLPDDFKRARQKRWPRIVQAVPELASASEWNPDKSENAVLLASLLEPPADAPVAPQPKKAVGYDDFDEPVVASLTAIQGLAPAVIQTLAANGTPEARSVLKKILLGQQPSDVDDRTLCVAAIQALVDHLDPENEKILLAVLVVPDSIRPAGRSQYTADQLHEDCVRLIRPAATAEFRLHLAQRMARGVSSPTNRKRNMGLLTAADKSNLAAKVELLVNGVADGAEVEMLEREFFQTSQQANEQLLRLSPQDWERALKAPADARPVRTSYDDNSPAVPLADLAAAVPHLWRKDLHVVLANRIRATEDRVSSNDSLRLFGASLPSEIVRRALLQYWKDNWSEEPGMTGAGSYLLDPGLVVVLKQMPRDTPLANGRAPSRQYADTPLGQKMAKEAAAKKAWLKLSETVTRALIDRCRQFAQHRVTVQSTAVVNQSVSSVAEFDKMLNGDAEQSPSNAARPQPTSASDQPDLNLRHLKETKVKLAYRASWPADLPHSLQGFCADTMEISYLRLETDGEMDAVAGHYKGQLRSSVVKPVDQGRWVDALLTADGRAASTDIFVTRLDRTGEWNARSEKLAIEILRVIVSDPAVTAQTASVSVSQKPLTN